MWAHYRHHLQLCTGWVNTLQCNYIMNLRNSTLFKSSKWILRCKIEMWNFFRREVVFASKHDCFAFKPGRLNSDLKYVSKKCISLEKIQILYKTNAFSRVLEWKQREKNTFLHSLLLWKSKNCPHSGWDAAGCTGYESKSDASLALYCNLGNQRWIWVGNGG